MILYGLEPIELLIYVIMLNIDRGGYVEICAY